MTLQVAIIGLRRLPERAARVSARLDALGVSHEIFPAVDAAQGGHLAWPNYDEAACLRTFGSALLPQEVACFASHFSLWQRCANEKRPTLILEDDVTLLDGFPDAVALAETVLRERPFIRLAGLSDRPYRVVEDLGARRIVRYLRAPCGAQAYALAPEGAATLMRGAGSWRETVDLYVDRFWVHGLLPYAIHPFEVLHEEAAEQASTIGPRLRKRRGWNKIRRELRRFRDEVARRLHNLKR